MSRAKKNAQSVAAAARSMSTSKQSKVTAAFYGDDDLKTQAARVLRMLESSTSVSTLAIRAAYVMSSGYVIHRLRSQGHLIQTDRGPGRIAIYSLIKSKKGDKSQRR